MERLTSGAPVPAHLRGAIMALGNFDGFHDGHQAVVGHAIDRARAEGRPASGVVAEVTDSLRELLGSGTPVTVYNAPYDLSLLAHECARHTVAPLATLSPIIDPLVLDKAVDRYRRGKRTLEVTAQHYGIALDDAHDAGAEAVAAGRVAQALVKA